MLIMRQGDTLAMGTPGEIRSLVRSDDNPQPTIDDAFIALAEGTVVPPPVQPGNEVIQESDR
jgi:ABC-2 type transport system ATP-binding protein